MEEHMKSRADLANRYDEWAEALLTCLDSLAGGIQEHQHWRASWVIASAAELRTRAADLRKIERRRSTNDSPLPSQVLTLK